MELRDCTSGRVLEGTAWVLHCECLADVVNVVHQRVEVGSGNAVWRKVWWKFTLRCAWGVAMGDGRGGRDGGALCELVVLLLADERDIRPI
jgi:hypothetical protein